MISNPIIDASPARADKTTPVTLAKLDGAEKRVSAPNLHNQLFDDLARHHLRFRAARCCASGAEPPVSDMTAGEQSVQPAAVEGGSDDPLKSIALAAASE
ncbi:hypothetical protein U1839_11025 [Sphingomonas sp. RT2P30]|uniref:hypothetical protein n=1 Tax=Parasphingomonas halimpatiens TaxID=3096162 RepID=UPI002FC77DF1